MSTNKQTNINHISNIKIPNKMNTVSKVQINNKWYTTNEIKSLVTPQVLADVAEYMIDPNCGADLWVSQLKHLSENEKVAFIRLAILNKICQLRYDAYNWGSLSSELHTAWVAQKAEFKAISGIDVPLRYNCPA